MNVSMPLGFLVLFTVVSAQAQVSSLPAHQVGYVMAQGSSTILVIDTYTNTIVNKLKHADLVRPAGGWSPTVVVFDSKAERVLRYIDLRGLDPGYGVALTPDKTRLYIPLGTPAQSAVAVVDVTTLTVIANIVDTELIGPRLVRFTHY